MYLCHVWGFKGQNKSGRKPDYIVLFKGKYKFDHIHIFIITSIWITIIPVLNSEELFTKSSSLFLLCGVF